MPNLSLFHFDLSVLLPFAWRRRQTVLVVEDEDATVGLIERSAKAEGFEVLHADSAEQAEGALLKNGRKFALVMLDIGLPGKCGWTLRRELLEQFPKLRVCMMSVTAESMLRAPTGELVLFIVKPATWSGVFRELRRIGI